MWIAEREQNIVIGRPPEAFFDEAQSIRVGREDLGDRARRGRRQLLFLRFLYGHP